MHVLWTCPVEVDVYGQGVSPVRKWHTYYGDFTGLWRELLMRLDGQQLDQIAIVSHKLWVRRNRWVFEQKFQSPTALYLFALDDVEVFKVVGQSQK